MMKKTLLTVLIILGLSFSTQSVADVKNLPVICSVPYEELKKHWSASNLKDYVLTNDPRESDILSGLSGKDLINRMVYLIEKRGLEPLDRNSFASDEDYLEMIKAQYSLVKGNRAITKFDMVILKLLDEPKLILQHGFYNHEQKIKNLKLKCPSGSRMIKPYNKKYNKDKLKINPSYLSQMKKRIKAENFNMDIHSENGKILFMLYVMSLESRVIIDDEIIRKAYDDDKRIKKLHKTKAEKNGNKWIEINNRIIELDKNELKPEDFDKFNLNTALRNIPNICNTPNYVILSTGIQTQMTSMFHMPKVIQDQHKNDIINFFKVLSEFPHLIFTQNFGYGTPRSPSVDWCWWSAIVSKPFDEVALKKGEIKLRKAYLNHVKKLPQKDKENLKFLLNLIC